MIIKNRKEKIELKDFKKLPNIISLFRLFCSFFILSSFLFNIQLVLVQACYILGAISDKADGIIARRFKWETKLGLYLEGIADGILIFTGIIYISFQTDFPKNLLALALLIFLFGVVFSSLIYILSGKWFTVTSPVVKISVLAGHIVVVLYIFSLPYRHQITTIIFYIGLGLFCYYLIKMARFGYRNWIKKKKQEK